MSPVLSIDTSKTVVILIGSSEFTNDPEKLLPLDSVKNNIEELARIFKDESIVGVPSANVVDLLNVPHASELMTTVARACKRAMDTLIVYYAGHGIVGRNTELYLATKLSTEAEAEQNAVRFELLRSAMQESIARKKILILDNCFSGIAIGGVMSSVLSSIRSRYPSGVSIITATPPNREALAPIGAKYTLFTDSLIKTLTQGIENGKNGISIQDLFYQIKTDLRSRNDIDIGGKEIPDPDILVTTEASKIIIAKNKKFTERVLTGRPLNGIVEILYQCYTHLKNATHPETSMWFAGLTCAFGPVHNIPVIRDRWLTRYPGAIGFDQISRNFNNYLLGILALSGSRGKVTIVTLQTDLIVEKFIKPLYAAGDYAEFIEDNKEYLTTVQRQIENFQNKVERTASVNGHKIKYVEEMPHQCIVTLLNGGKKEMRATDILIGTATIGMETPKGFYYNDGNCEALKNYVENLYASAKNLKQAH